MIAKVVYTRTTFETSDDLPISLSTIPKIVKLSSAEWDGTLALLP
jgi:hypothetical protein